MTKDRPARKHLKIRRMFRDGCKAKTVELVEQAANFDASTKFVHCRLMRVPDRTHWVVPVVIKGVKHIGLGRLTIPKDTASFTFSKRQVPPALGSFDDIQKGGTYYVDGHILGKQDLQEQYDANAAELYMAKIDQDSDTGYLVRTKDNRLLPFTSNDAIVEKVEGRWKKTFTAPHVQRY